MFAEAVGGIGRDAYKLGWRGDAWSPEWHFGFGTAGIRPAPALRGRRPFVFYDIQGFEDPNLGMRQWVLLSEDLGDHPAPIDTVAHTNAGFWSYGAACSERRKWVAFRDVGGLRLLYSDTLHVWRELPSPGACDAGVVLAAVDDTTALLVWGDTFESLRWGYLRGTGFEEGPPPPGREVFAGTPRLLPQADGSFLVIWGTKENHIGYARLRGTTWSERESLQCAYDPPGTYYTIAQPHFSQPAGLPTAVAWSGYAGGSYTQEFCITCATDSGFPVAEPVPTDDIAIPTFTRDGLGDYWVAWYTEDIQGMFWRHSYVRATASPPRFTGNRDAPLVSWALSEPAPESWWTLLRAEGDGAFAAVARLRAGPDTLRSYADSAAPAGRLLRYKLRRECVDKRYQWESEAAEFWPRGAALELSLASRHPAQEDVTLRVGGAQAGPLRVSVYDVQGRRVWAPEASAGGTGRDEVRLTFRAAPHAITSGLYLLRVADRTGRAAAPLKLVVVR